jgi:histidinol dehydrogenase
MIQQISSMELTEATIKNYLPRAQEHIGDIVDKVRQILDRVKKEGDSAIQDLSLQFDRIDPNKKDAFRKLPLRITPQEIQDAYAATDPALIDALKRAKANIEKFHAGQLHKEWEIETVPGVRTGQIFRPLERVGLYIPGGQAVYPSTVLMTAAVAKIAGVPELVLCSPPQADGTVASAILVAADLCKVDYIFRCGGAQAIAGMAYGTKSIPPVMKIVGPGNKWVAAAKQAVSGICAIDNPAGPSEILLVVDENTNPEWAAYDMLAQIEHGPDNVAVCLSQSQGILNKISGALTYLVEKSPRKAILEENLKKYGLYIKAMSQKEMIRIINIIAAEHLHLNLADARKLLPEIRNAGAVFLGPYSPVPLGDYCAGTNHVLPTAGYARFYSGLSTRDFIKEMDVLECNREGLGELAKILQPIADFEGLPAHRDAVLIRTKNNKS